MELGLKDGTKRIIAIVTIVIAVICLGWRAKWTWDAYQHQKAELQACDDAISKTQTDIQAQRQELTDVNKEKNEILANFHELDDAGIKVAQLQNEWSTYVYRRSICQAGEQEAYDREIYNVEVQLKDLFSEVPYGWYAVRGTGVGWICAVNYAFYTNNLRVVWLFQDLGLKTAQDKINSSVYAYAIADYSYDTKKFSNVEVYITDLGEKYGVDRGVKAYPEGDFPVIGTNGSLNGNVSDVVLGKVDMTPTVGPDAMVSSDDGDAGNQAVSDEEAGASGEQEEDTSGESSGDTAESSEDGGDSETSGDTAESSEDGGDSETSGDTAESSEDGGESETSGSGGTLFD